ncbi:MAG: transposase [Rhodocyclaceae bacterium]|nr:transposase [Rhodocyclaceae bacterium]MBX3670238.1 transposase [Rhodocyclaceae bacterium]
MKTGSPKRSYTVEFRQEAVRQVMEVKRGVREVARGLDVSEKTLENWLRAARRGLPLVKGEASQVENEHTELVRLRAENARLKMDVEILKKAAAYFARENR